MLCFMFLNEKGGINMFRIARDKEKWAYIREVDEYKKLRDMLFNDYNEYCKDQGIPMLTFSDEMDFINTGSRKRFENKYFHRRIQLSVYCLLSLLYPEKDEYLKKLEDVISAICTEYSWEVPAHRACDRLNKRNGIDLFAAETGLYLAEVKYVLCDRLDPMVVERITNEIKWRIIESFKNESFIFEKYKSNWASVCGGSVGATLLYEDLDTYMLVKPRIEKCMENYLAGLGDDGSCSESADYWNYGFSYYLLYNELLRNHTRGRLDYLKNEKVKKTASFLESVFLDNKNVANFSDAGQMCAYNLGTVYFLNKEYGTGLPPADNGIVTMHKTSWALRSFLYYDAGVKTELKSKISYYENLGWYIDRRDNFAFAIKGGHNAEEHNHNDVGSFILTYKEKVIFAELGAPEYTATTFKNKERSLNSASIGHSVPIIDGEAQKSGREYFGVMAVSDNEVTVDMTKAYPTGDKKFIRCCRLADNEFVLMDEFDSSSHITERFILLSKPTIMDGCFEVEGVLIAYSKTHSLKYSEVDNVLHDGKTHRTVYILDFEAAEATNKFELRVNLEV